MATTTDGELFDEDSPPTSSADFEQFYEKLSVHLIGLGIAWGLSRHDAVEEAQETMVRALDAWHKRGLSRKSYPEQEAYVVTSMKNALVDRYRAQGRLRTLLQKLGNQAQTSHVRWEQELETPTLDLLQSLPRQQRQILTLMSQGFAVPEAAEHLGITASTARSHLQKARKTLRELLEAREANSDG